MSWLLLSLAYAAELVPTDQLDDAIRAAQLGPETPLVIVAAGPEAQRAAQAAAAGLPAQIVMVPILGDAEAQATAARGDVACGVRIAAAGGGYWSVSRHGTCATTAYVPTTTAPTTPVVVMTAPASQPAAPLTGGSWEVAFASAAAQIGGADLRILVANAGTPAAEGDAAALALEAALRRDTRVRLVMNDAALGDLTTTDDATLVKKASPFPVDQVHVLRVFPGNSGGWTAVVTIYRPDGSAFGGFVAEQTTAAPPTTATPTGLGIAASNAIAEVTHTQTTSLEARQKEYDEKHLQVGQVVGLNQYGQVIASGAVITRGRYGQEVRPTDFYAIIDRPDLVQKVKNRQATQAIAIVGGVLVTGVGLAILTTASPIVVSVLVVSGTTAATTALFISPHPVDVPTIRRLVDDYNTALRADLGLPAE